MRKTIRFTQFILLLSAFQMTAQTSTLLTREDSSKLANAYYQEGMVAKDSSDWQLAENTYGKALQFSPKAVNAWSGRAWARYNLNKYTESIADYTKAIQLNPDDAENFSDRGSVLAEAGKKLEAIADFSQAIRLQPNYPYAFNARGLVYYGLGKYSEAIADFEKAIVLDPNFAQPYANKGRVLIKLDDKTRLNEAVALLDKGLSLNKKMGWAEDSKKEALAKLKN